MIQARKNKVDNKDLKELADFSERNFTKPSSTTEALGNTNRSDIELYYSNVVDKEKI